MLDEIRLGVAPGTNTSGSASAAVRSTGLLEGIHLSWDTAIVTKTVSYMVQTGGVNAPVETLFSGTVASNASGWFYPRKNVHTSAGASATLDGTRPVLEKFILNDNLVFVVSGSDANLASSPVPYNMRAYWRQ